MPHPTLASVQAPRTRSTGWVTVGTEGVQIQFVPRAPATVCYGDRCMPVLAVTDLILRLGAQTGERR